jgi:hypothetical protein
MPSVSFGDVILLIGTPTELGMTEPGTTKPGTTKPGPTISECEQH